MADNKDLRNANREKKDEFYTQLEDIEKELKYYKKEFKDKVIFCNCDDPYESNFFKYFALNFNAFGLKKLIATCYATSPFVGEEIKYGVDKQGQFYFFGPEETTQTESAKKPYKIEITEVKDHNGDGAVDLADVEYLLKNEKNTLTLLNGDGDFRSEECIELLKQADIVATNPPFSLFREYVAQLIKYEKKFIIIGNVNAITYREIFPLLKNNKMWLGKSIHSGDREFKVPQDYSLNASGCRVDEQGNKYIRVKGVRWYSNIDYEERHQDLLLYKTYNEEEYPMYYNFDAINVNKVVEIPCDYNGVIGVPITFLDKYNPDQFEIIGLGISNSGIEVGVRPYTEEHKKYRKEIQKRGAVDGDLYMLENGVVNVPYARILIKKKR